MELVVSRARELLGAAASVVELAEHDEMVYHVASGAAEPYVGLRLPVGGSLSGLCLARGEMLYCEDAATDERVDIRACKRVGAMSMVCVPLKYEERSVGVLKVYDPRPYAFDEADLQTLALLSGVIGAHMAHASDFEMQLHASRHDVLTGLANRRGFDERLAMETSRARRYDGELALCLLDLDRFKYVNDTFGHAAGDQVLRAVAAHLQELRGEDGAFRFGGDEFAFMLVGSSQEGADLVAERIAFTVQQDPACHGVTVSWGTATLEDGDPIAMLERADEALYDAKAHRYE